MRAILLASALMSVLSVSPADLALPRGETIIAYTHPAVMLMLPPNNAEIAPCAPPHQPATSVSAMAAYNCHRRTARRGLLRTVLTARGSSTAKFFIVLSPLAPRQTVLR